VVETVQSADGTTIAFERAGTGPAVILIGGALSTRHGASGLAELLSPHFTVYTWDRRGRGDSSDTMPYSVRREIEDLGALVAAAGQPCCVYGHSSGGALALEAAQQGLPMAGLAAYEPPYMVEGEPDDDFNGLVSRAVEEGRPEEALALFIGNAMPGSLDDMKQSPFWPSLVELAPTLPYDLAIVHDGSIPVGRFAAIDTPTLLLVGGTSPSWAAVAAEAIVASVPGAVRHTVEGQDHRAANEAVAPILIQFFGGLQPPNASHQE
jgi:pimeloyl-ACP methyl ester carboxylesterase